MNEAARTLKEIVDMFGGELRGDGAIHVESIASLKEATPRQISFLANPKYRNQLPTTKAAAVIVDEQSAADCPGAVIVTPHPYMYFARLSRWLAPRRPMRSGRHPTAIVEGLVPESAQVGPYAWIGPGARVGEDVVIGPYCHVGEESYIGDDCRLYANVTVYHNCHIGKRALIHAGAVIGADGFGFARHPQGQWEKIAQNGRVVIGDDVEIGANTCIDRGAIGDTVIGDGVKLDNLIQVGHNVHVGEHCAFAGCVGVAGSSIIGDRCTIAGGAVVLGHLTLAADVNVSAATLVTKPIGEAGVYTGAPPFMPHGEWLRNFSHLRQLDAMADRIRRLEKQLEEMTEKGS